ncbi:MAG TPA: hypothetical protein VEI97_03135, partial [bacterium]|nr:hypothetical protein [bacterium]
VEYEGEVSRMVRGYGDGATYTEHMVQFFKGKAFAVGHIESLDPKRAQQRLMEYQTLYGPGEGELTADGPGSHSWSDPANGRLLLMVWEWAVAVPGTPQPPMRMFDIVTLLVDATRSAQADHYLKAREAAEARNPTP